MRRNITLYDGPHDGEVASYDDTGDPSAILMVDEPDPGEEATPYGPHTPLRCPVSVYAIEWHTDGHHDWPEGHYIGRQRRP